MYPCVCVCACVCINDRLGARCSVRGAFTQHFNESMSHKFVFFFALDFEHLNRPRQCDGVGDGEG